MKKIVILFIITLFAVSVFAQKEWIAAQENENVWRNNRQTSIVLNPIPFIIGTTERGIGVNPGFEYAFTPEFAVKGQLYYMGYDPTSMYVEGSFLSSFRISAEGRWYPMQYYIRGVFAGVGLQAQVYTGSFTVNKYTWEQDIDTEKYYEVLVSSNKYDKGGSVGFYTSIGYKFTIGKGRNALVVEPSLDYISSFYFGDWGDLTYYSSPFGMMETLGFRFSLNLGVAF